MNGMLALFRFNKRPALDTQNTGRDVYVRPLAPANVTINGWGGFSNFGSLAPTAVTGFNKPYVATASITGQGNGYATNPNLVPLNDKATPAPTSSAQF